MAKLLFFLELRNAGKCCTASHNSSTTKLHYQLLQNILYFGARGSISKICENMKDNLDAATEFGQTV
jgi:hypothetical protein